MANVPMAISKQMVMQGPVCSKFVNISKHEVLSSQFTLRASTLNFGDHRILFNISQFDEQKDQVLVEQILQVVFLDAESPSRVSSLK